MAETEVLPETTQAARDFEDTLYTELQSLRDRLSVALQNTQQAFLDECMAVPKRTRAEHERISVNCHAQAEQLFLQMRLLLERHADITNVRLGPWEADDLGKVSANARAYLVSIKQMIAAEIAKFEETISAVRRNLVQQTFALCDARSFRTRQATLAKAAVCQRQVQRLEAQIGRLLRMLPSGGDRPPFVYVEEKYNLKITRPDYPLYMWNLLPLPFLKIMIESDPRLAEVACVPSGFGVLPDPYHPRHLNALRRGQPLLLEQQAGNLWVFPTDSLRNDRNEEFRPKVAHEPLLTKGVDGDLLLLMQREFLSADILKCASTKRFILLLLTSAEHQNALLIDMRTHTVEHIEPHGGRSYEEYSDSSLHFEAVAKLFIERTLNTLGFGRFVYVPPTDVCPYIGPQTRSQHSRHGGGYCVAWVTLILLARILNPAYSTREVQDNIINGRSPKYLKDLIRAFIEFVDTVIAQNKIAYPGIQEDMHELSRFHSASPSSPFQIEDAQMYL